MVTKYDDAKDLIRTSVFVPKGTHQALKDLADEGKRPLSWEIRQALERWVDPEAVRDRNGGK